MPTSDDLPRYTRWAQVPEGLLTRTQLAKLDPPRKATKDTPVVGRVLYAGNKYTDLYHLDDTVVKPPPTEAQLAAAARAKAAQYVCKRCGGRDVDGWGEPIRLGKGRFCSRCHRITAAWTNHLGARQHAREILEKCAQNGALAIATDHERGHAVVLGYAQVDLECGGRGRLLKELEWTGRGDRTVFDEINHAVRLWNYGTLGNFHARPEIISWAPVRTDLVRLLDPSADWTTLTREALATRKQAWEAAEEYSWLQQFSGPPDAVAPVRYSRWHTVGSNWPNYHAQVRPGCEDYTGPSASLTWDLSMPGATGDLLADTRAIMPLLHRMAEGAEPTGEPTPWTLHPALDTWEGR